jgi:hypothetical protein
MTVFSAEENVPSGAQETQPFQYGIFNLRPHPFYRFLYGNGMLSKTNQAENTVINQLSPGFILEIGRHWTLDFVKQAEHDSSPSSQSGLGMGCRSGQKNPGSQRSKPGGKIRDEQSKSKHGKSLRNVNNIRGFQIERFVLFPLEHSFQI